MDHRPARKLETRPLRTSLTSFTDFVLESGLRKLLVAERILRQYQAGYRQGADYYKRLRDAIVRVHSSGASVSSLGGVVDAVSFARHQANYQHMVRGYQQFWARNFQELEACWCPPARARWSLAHLVVTINPELGFRCMGDLHLIKLYLRKDPPSPAQLQIILHLMQLTLWSQETKPVVSVLDVRRGRLFEATSYDARFDPLLRGEAMSLVTMCRMLESDHAAAAAV